MDRFHIPDSCKTLMDLQVTGSGRDPDLLYKTTVDDFDLLSDWLSPGGVMLDIGCGIGRWSAYVGAQPDWGSTLFVLADASRTSDHIRFGWRPGQIYYNSLDATREFVVANGLRDFQLFDIEQGNWQSLPMVSTVVSLLAVGFHWPIEPTLKKLSSRLSSTTRLVFQVRRGRYTRSSFSAQFGFCEIRARNGKSDFLLLSDFTGGPRR